MWILLCLWSSHVRTLTALVHARAHFLFSFYFPLFVISFFYTSVAIRRDEYDGKSEPLKGSFLLRTYSRTDTGHYLARHRANLRVARLFLYLCLNCFFFCYEFVQVNVSVFIHRERLWSNFPPPIIFVFASQIGGYLQCHLISLPLLWKNRLTKLAIHPGSKTRVAIFFLLLWRT